MIYCGIILVWLQLGFYDLYQYQVQILMCQGMNLFCLQLCSLFLVFLFDVVLRIIWKKCLLIFCGVILLLVILLQLMFMFFFWCCYSVVLVVSLSDGVGVQLQVEFWFVVKQIMLVFLVIWLVVEIGLQFGVFMKMKLCVVIVFVYLQIFIRLVVLFLVIVFSDFLRMVVKLLVLLFVEGLLFIFVLFLV